MHIYVGMYSDSSSCHEPEWEKMGLLHLCVRNCRLPDFLVVMAVVTMVDLRHLDLHLVSAFRLDCIPLVASDGLLSVLQMRTRRDRVVDLPQALGTG